LDMRKRGGEGGRDLSPNAQYQNSPAKPTKRKLVILPAKPPPRKTKSVMKGHAPESDLLAKSRGPSVTRRRPDGGIIDELKRVDELNSALAGYTVPTALNLKALKNQSFQATELLQGEPQRTFASSMYEKDRVMFMSKQIGKKKPIFKNYQQNNTFILRKEAQEKKRDQLRAAEEKES